MNIIEAEDMVKGLPDQVLFQEAQFPSGRIPQYLAVSEVQRRQDMRQRFQAQQAGQQQPTVKDQILQGGIGATGMAPPISTAPPMAPAAPPMPQGAPVGMADGGTVPAGTGRFFGGFGPELLNSPDRLQRMYGSMNPGVDNYAARGSGLNLSDVKEFIKNPDAEKYSDAIASTIAQGAQAQAALNRGLRAPEGGAYGGGGGGGLPYGGPTSYAGRDALRDLIDQVNMQQGQQGKPTVTVEEIPTNMAVGGVVPSQVREAVDSALTPSPSVSQSSLPSTGPSRETVIRKVKALIAQGREMDALVLLRQAGINPSELNMATGGMTPGGIVYMQEGKQLPNDPSAAMFASMMSRLPDAFSAIRGMMPAPAGISAADLERFKPTREQYFDPETERRRAELLTRLEQMGTTRKAEDIAAAERYLKEAEAPIQAAQDEARKAAIASTLMRLGAGVAAGRGAEGLASAAQGVEQTMGRAREVAAAERRAARQDFRAAEREAVRGQRAMADQAFLMQAQNITSDENKQQQFVRDQNQFAQWAFTQQREAGRDQQQAFNNALQLSVGLTQAVDTAVREATRERNLTERQYASTFGSIFKEVLGEVKEADFGTDEEGNPITPTADQLISTARQKTTEALEAAGIYSPASVVTVNTPAELEALTKGQRYRGPDGIVRIKP